MDDAGKCAKPTYTINNLRGDLRLDGKMKVKLFHYSP